MKFLYNRAIFKTGIKRKIYLYYNHINNNKKLYI